jgi:hypothetical protein
MSSKLEKERAKGRDFPLYASPKQNVVTASAAAVETKNQEDESNEKRADEQRADEQRANEKRANKPTELESYSSFVKKAKRDNITPENIGEILLCQIPGISAVTALTIMEKFQTLPNLIKEMELNNDCLKDICSTNSKGQTRKINKTSIANIVKFLLKK